MTTYLLIGVGANRDELLAAAACGSPVAVCIAPGDVAPGGGIPWDVLNAKLHVDAVVRVEVTDTEFGGIAILHCKLTPQALEDHPEVVEAGWTTFWVHGFELMRGRAQCKDARLTRA